MFRWCLFSVYVLTFQPACLALVLGQIHGIVDDAIDLQPVPAPPTTSTAQVADGSASLRVDKKIEERELTLLGAAPSNVLDGALKVTAPNAKLESSRSEATIESVFPGWGDTIELQPVPVPSIISPRQVADVSALVRPEQKMEERWLTSLSAAPLNVLDNALKATASNTKLESPFFEASFDSVFSGWSRLLLAEIMIIIAALLTYFWPSSRTSAADALTQFEKMSFESTET
jgi:hypothetical protein